MDKIEVAVLNPHAVEDAERLMVLGARLTQRSDKIHSMEDMMALYKRSYSNQTVHTMASLPHPNIQRQAMITIAMVGISRRFWSQITRHQDDVHFVGGSLQYNDYSDSLEVVIPYEIMELDHERIGNAELEEGYHRRNFINSCRNAINDYRGAIEQGVPHDAAGYIASFGMRQVAIMSATAWEWHHIIAQRICRRNTFETQYVMLRCWEELEKLGEIFANCGPFCTEPGGCREGKFCCMRGFITSDVMDRIEQYGESIPTAYLNVNFPLIRQKQIKEAEGK